MSTTTAEPEVHQIEIEEVDLSDLENHDRGTGHARCVICYPTVDVGDVVPAICGVNVFLMNTHPGNRINPVAGVTCEGCIAKMLSRSKPCGH